MSWRGRKQTGPTIDKIETVVGRSCVVRGDLAADGAFRIDGTIEGSVESRAAVVIGESGAVTGNVRAVDVLVAGKVHGNVCCSGHLDIVSTGVIEGEIEAKSLRVETGGVFAGTSHMGAKPAAPESAAEVPPSLSAVR
ncbi:MAG: polymer-forming cytoskeletal protein [Deltaproteobacteria bacterium]|jgi:cytoskeletal protein CcmA (bactofilin family)|nr:polymer-forming cytoskeletal protein [Deltaproteobacteria bacterium]